MEHRMTTAGGGPRRVLVVWYPAGPGRDVADAEPDARAFEQVVTVVEGFCPQVEVLYPGACAVAARGPARYFGGEEALAGKIIEAVARRGFACQVGVADGLFAAQLAARAAQLAVVAPGETPAFLAPHPVSSLGNPELAGLLPRLGIRTLGEFAALSPAEAENRFGAQGALAHRLARGLDPRPLAPRPPSVDLSVSVEFDPPADQSEPVVFAAKTLAERMHAGLAARGLACVRVQVQAFCEDGQEITRLWRHDGLLSALAVAERARWQLAGWRAARTAGTVRAAGAVRAVVEGATGDGNEAGGITLLRLIPDQLVRDEGRQLGLWGDAVISDRVARAAVRVQAMLGHGAVTRPVLAGGRSPADQVTLVPFGDAVDPRYPVGQPWPGRLPAPAPATICPVPLPVTVTDDSGGAVTVTGRAMVSAPPARLSGGRPSGGRPSDGRPSGGRLSGGRPSGGRLSAAQMEAAQFEAAQMEAAQFEAAQFEAAQFEAARRPVDGGPWLAITSWAGPWPADERWWRPADACRKARFQLVTGDGSAWLATVQNGRWLIEAGYDLPASGAGPRTQSSQKGGPEGHGLGQPAAPVARARAAPVLGEASQAVGRPRGSGCGSRGRGGRGGGSRDGSGRGCKGPNAASAPGGRPRRGPP
jgi:protein ImuB